MKNLEKANRRARFTLRFIVRSDSTLRGHFPLELSVVRERCGRRVDAVFVIPAFFEGNRVTKDGVHYIVEDGEYVRCDQTPFARDSVFGYRSSYLPEYIEEKTRTPARDVIVLTPGGIADDDGLELGARIEGLSGGPYVAVNAGGYPELDRFTAACRHAEAEGKFFLYQSAASFVKSYVQSPDRPYLGSRRHRGAAASQGPGPGPDHGPSGEQPGGPGIVIAGSYVPQTTRQLEKLSAARGTSMIEVDVKRVLGDPDETCRHVGNRIAESVRAQRTPVVYTSRKELVFANRDERQRAGQAVSKALSRIVRELSFTPSFIIAKGGITAHVVLTDGLEISLGRVAGQCAAGVPALILPEGHRFSGILYVVFPGNVGDDSALADLYLRLSEAGTEAAAP
jgi:uncharacterized protein YgbK (DUF1537 family)